jgi:hypothetical protein
VYMGALYDTESLQQVHCALATATAVTGYNPALPAAAAPVTYCTCLRQPCLTQAFVSIIGGEVVTSRYFHRKAVLSYVCNNQ